MNNPLSNEQAIWQQLQGIVADALEQDVSSRLVFVAERCGDDLILRDKVLALLKEADTTGNFLSMPVADVAQQFAAAATIAASGTQFGAWQIEKKIGEGGMGLVYLAHRADGAYEQQAALKTLRALQASPEQQRAMARERQTLAQVQHANIARLLDGGTTPEGVPYLVMEYIEGQNISQYCTEQNLTVRARVELVVALCGAVQSAHQALVIHRDIKPSNILVDKTGVPKLLDFGVARLLEAGADLYATQGPAQFTPRYASPEQMQGQPVSVATDVYALGLLLYELLAGDGPFERASRSAGMASTREPSIANVIDAVLNDTPQTASDVAARQSPAFVASLKGELDTILKKACSKKPADRYQTVAQLQDDLLRHLNGKPILARPQSAFYTFAKFVGRHKLASAASVAAVVALAAVATVALIQKQKADLRYQQAREITHSFVMTHYPKIREIAGASAVLKPLTVDALKYLDQLTDESNENVEVALERAEGYGNLSHVMYNDDSIPHLNDVTGAKAALEKSRAILADVLKREPNNVDALATHGALYTKDAYGKWLAEDKLAEALALFEKSADFALRAQKLNPKHQRAGLIRAGALVGMSGVKAQLGQDGLAELNEAAIATELAVKNYPDDPKTVFELKTQVLRSQATYAISNKKYADLITHTGQEIAVIEAMFKGVLPNPADLRSLYIAYALKGLGQMELKQNDAAIATTQRTLELIEEFKKLEPADTKMVADRARMHYVRTRAFADSGSLPEALAESAQGIAQYKTMVPPALNNKQIQRHGELILMRATIAVQTKNSQALNESRAQLNALEKTQPAFFKEPPAATFKAQMQALKL